jgi:hypothetical protein
LLIFGAGNIVIQIGGDYVGLPQTDRRLERVQAGSGGPALAFHEATISFCFNNIAGLKR